MASDYIKEIANTDDIFLRNVLAGTQGFFDKKIFFNQKNESGGNDKINVPMYTSYVGDEQFLMDYYYNIDPSCGYSKVSGTTNVVPSGVFNLNGANIPTTDIMNKFERAIHTAKISTEYGEELRNLSSRTFFIPILMEFDATIKTSSDNMRQKVWQSVVRTLYKVKKFYIVFEGFSRIPCLITFPENYNIPKELKFEYPDAERRPELKFSFEILTYLPDPDESTERFQGNKMDRGTVTHYKLSDEGLDLMNPKPDE